MTENNNLYKALLYLEKHCPEIFYIIRAVKIESSDKMPSAGVMPTKNGYKMLINSEWLNTFDSYNLAALIEHEILHVVLVHLSEYMEIPNHLRQMLNIAQDCIINDIGKLISNKSKLNSKLKNGVFLSEFNSHYNTDFNTDNNTSLEIFEFLKKEQKNDNGKGNSDNGNGNNDSNNNGNGNSSSNDSLESFDLGQLAPDNSEGNSEGNGNGEKLDNLISQELKDHLESVIGKAQLKEIVKNYSKNSNEFKMHLENLENIDKNTQIKNAISKFIAGHKNNYLKSVKRPNRRFTGNIYGRLPDKTQRILLAVDSSGSMLSPSDLEKIQMSINTAINFNFKVDIICGDTEKTGEFKNVKRNFDMTQISGGGGTELKFIFEEKLSNYDCIVVVTDGYFDWREIPIEQKRKILFLNTTGREIENFKNLFI